jgi:hypothetical protein
MEGIFDILMQNNLSFPQSLSGNPKFSFFVNNFCNVINAR